MKNELRNILAVVLVAVGFYGCGGAAADGESEDSLSQSKKSHVTVRRDQRRCPSPACGGYFVRDANKTTSEQYVGSLDFSAAGLDGATIDPVVGAPAGEIILLGKLTPADAKTKVRSFKVSAAWRGMPGRMPAAGDMLFSAASTGIQCIAAPCHNQAATKLNDTAITSFSHYDVASASTDFVDQEWLTSRVRDHGGLVAARIVDGVKLAAGPERVLAASQVFVKLPETAGPCTKAQVNLSCAAGEMVVYQRDQDRCAMPVACARPGVCTQSMPSCDEGYSLVQWRSGPNACNASACDPTFSL